MFDFIILLVIDTDTRLCVYLQVLTDQSEWAVCGRSAGVVNMDTARKQTVVVEVMALVGGHLPLPKVKLSKYIPADMKSSHKSMPDHCNEGSKQNSSASDDASQNIKAAMKGETNDPVFASSSNQHSSTNNGKSFYI